MNAQEKRVIRWKRDLLAANIIFNEQTIKQLQSRGLLWDNVLEQCETETANCGKVWKFLEHLMRVNVERNVFEAFLAFLDDEHPWISTELKVEMELEKGNLKIDEYIKNEASKLVHRQFGTTKRFSEQEKKSIEDLIAVRSQCTKNIWIRNVEETRKVLDDQVAVGIARDELIVKLCKKIEEYLQGRGKVQKMISSRSQSTERLPTLTPDFMMSVGVIDDKSSKSLIAKLDYQVEKLISFVKTTVENLDDLKEEQSRGFQLLAGSGTGVAIDKGAYMTMQRIADQLREYKAQDEASQNNINELEDEIENMKIKFNQDSEERDRAIRYLTACLEKSETRGNQAEEELYNVKNHLKKNTDELMTLDQKNQLLEKHRHYAYWFDRHDVNADPDAKPTADKRSSSVKKRTGKKSVKKRSAVNSPAVNSPAATLL